MKSDLEFRILDSLFVNVPLNQKQIVEDSFPDGKPFHDILKLVDPL